MKKILAYTVATGFVLLPGLVLAQGATFGGVTANAIGVLANIKVVINFSLTVLLGVAVLVFFWGLIRYILAQGDADERKKARSYIIYGIVAFVIIVGLFGFVNVILSALGLSGTNTVVPPQVS